MAGSASATGACAARLSARNPMTPRRRADARASPRSTSWYSRRATITAGTATSTGAVLVYRSVAPVCARKTTMPPMAAAQAVTSKTTRGSQDQRRRAFRRRGRRCCQAATTPGPAAAMASVAMPGHQAAGPAGAAPGTRSTATAQASAAAGTQATAAPRVPSENSCQSDAPRARRRASSADRRAAIIRAARSSVTMPATARPA